MCLAVPAQIISRDEMLALVDMDGIQRSVSVMLLPDVKQGDFVLVHAGFAMQLIDEKEAEFTMGLLKELAEHGSLPE
ncbi:hydrogenase assembly protein HypC [Sporomusaceae bacterium FL31]|nr:hydrogenase assembly protein HypC [Sporomusaceae bacterium FL31]GCE33208.1 hydrogenase assembly protein HypC [Sporomusaceae bacterium]